VRGQTRFGYLPIKASVSAFHAAAQLKLRNHFNGLGEEGFSLLVDHALLEALLG
jgi:hypothetical protein